MIQAAWVTSGTVIHHLRYWSGATDTVSSRRVQERPRMRYLIGDSGYVYYPADVQVEIINGLFFA